MFPEIETTQTTENVELSLFDPTKVSIPKENIELLWYDPDNISIGTLEVVGDIRKAVPHLSSGFSFALTGPQSIRGYLDEELSKFGATVEWKENTLEGTLTKPGGRELNLPRFLSWMEDGVHGGVVSVNTKGTYYVFQQGALSSRNRKTKNKGKSSSFWVGQKHVQKMERQSTTLAQQAARQRLEEMESMAKLEEFELMDQTAAREELSTLAKSVAFDIAKTKSEDEEERAKPPPKPSLLKRFSRSMSRSFGRKKIAALVAEPAPIKLPDPIMVGVVKPPPPDPIIADLVQKPSLSEPIMPEDFGPKTSLADSITEDAGEPSLSSPTMSGLGRQPSLEDPVMVEDAKKPSFPYSTLSDLGIKPSLEDDAEKPSNPFSTTLDLELNPSLDGSSIESEDEDNHPIPLTTMAEGKICLCEI